MQEGDAMLSRRRCSIFKQNADAAPSSSPNRATYPKLSLAPANSPPADPQGSARHHWPKAKVSAIAMALFFRSFHSSLGRQHSGPGFRPLDSGVLAPARWGRTLARARPRGGANGSLPRQKISDPQANPCRRINHQRPTTGESEKQNHRAPKTSNRFCWRDQTQKRDEEH